MRFDLRRYYYKGEVKSLSAWAAEYGQDPGVVRRRLARGMTLHEALTEPRLTEKPANKCKGCRYLQPFDNHYTADCFCAYILITGHKRPCTYNECRGWDMDGNPVRKERKEKT